MKVMKRTLPIWAVLLILATMIPAVYAMTITALPSLRISIFTGSVSASNFSIQSQNVQFQGANRAKITLVLQNTDTTAAHSANVTVTIQDSAGNPVYVYFQLTGTIAASSTVTLTQTVSQAGITAAYSSLFVQVEDLS